MRAPRARARHALVDVSFVGGGLAFVPREEGPWGRAASITGGMAPAQGERGCKRFPLGWGADQGTFAALL